MLPLAKGGGDQLTDVGPSLTASPPPGPEASFGLLCLAGLGARGFLSGRARTSVSPALMPLLKGPLWFLCAGSLS